MSLPAFAESPPTAGWLIGMSTNPVWALEHCGRALFADRDVRRALEGNSLELTSRTKSPRGVLRTLSKLSRLPFPPILARRREQAPRVARRKRPLGKLPRRAEGALASEPWRTRTHGRQPLQAGALASEPRRTRTHGRQPRRGERPLASEPRRTRTHGRQPRRAGALASEPRRTRTHGRQPRRAGALASEPRRTRTHGRQPRRGERPLALRRRSCRPGAEADRPMRGAPQPKVA